MHHGAHHADQSDGDQEHQAQVENDADSKDQQNDDFEWYGVNEVPII